MAAPMYTPATGKGTTYTDNQGSSYLFNGYSWDQISTGKGKKTTAVKPPTPTVNNYSVPAFQPVQAPVTADSMIQTAISSFQKTIDEARKRGAEFDAKNPFVFDDILAEKRKEVSARLDPYYTQTLTDYLRGVDTRKSRSIEDQKTVLNELTNDATTYTGRAKDTVDEAIRVSKDGFADSGLFFSGKSLRKTGSIQASGNENLSDYNTNLERNKNKINTTTDRFLSDLSLESSTKQRDINQEKTFNVESGALQETQLANLRRELERNQYVGTPYAGNSLNQFATNVKSYI
jgi:hypothetical protein